MVVYISKIPRRVYHDQQTFRNQTHREQDYDMGFNRVNDLPILDYKYRMSLISMCQFQPVKPVGRGIYAEYSKYSHWNDLIYRVITGYVNWQVRNDYDQNCGAQIGDNWENFPENMLFTSHGYEIYGKEYGVNVGNNNLGINGVCTPNNGGGGDDVTQYLLKLMNNPVLRKVGK